MLWWPAVEIMKMLSYLRRENGVVLCVLFIVVFFFPDSCSGIYMQRRTLIVYVLFITNI